MSVRLDRKQILGLSKITDKSRLDNHILQCIVYQVRQAPRQGAIAFEFKRVQAITIPTPTRFCLAMFNSEGFAFFGPSMSKGDLGTPGQPRVKVKRPSENQNNI